MGYKVHFPKMYPWQKAPYMDVINDRGKGDTYLIKSRRQCGKSVVAIAICLFFALRAKSIGVICEPTLNQSRRVFRQIIGSLGGSKSPLIKSANQTLLSIEFINGSEINLCSAEQGDALRGQTVKNSVLVVDEGAFIDPEIYDILQPLVDVKRCPTVIISTPLFKSGTFWEKYEAGINGDKHVHVYDWAEYDTSELLSKEKLEYYRNTMSPLRFQSEYLAQFISEGSYVFGDISKCYGPLSREVPVYAGIDWSAGNDNDFTVLTLMDEDARICDIKSWKNFDAVDLIDAIALEISKYPSLQTAQVELNSIGKVYRDNLKRKVRKGLLRDFNTTNESKRRVVEQLIEAFQQGQITIPQDKELVKELQHYSIERTEGGKVTYNGERGVHDDFVVSLALTYDLCKKKTGVAKPRFKVLD